MGKPVAVFCAALLLAGLIGTFTYGIVHYTGYREKKVAPDSGEPALATTNKAIQSLCQPTTYQDTCVNSLEGAAGNTTDPKKLVRVGFNLAKEAIQDAINKSATIQAAKNDPRSAQALEICREVMVYARNDLQKTVDTSGRFDNVKDVNLFVENIKVWLGGAATYQDVCFDAFQNATDTAAGAKIREMFKTARELTSNALTMIDEVKKMISLLDIPASGSRRLLRIEVPQAGLMPEWLTDVQRNILEKPVGELKVDAVVALDGTGQFKNIGEALATIPKHNLKPFVVYIKAGVYHEHVTIQKKMTNVVLIGDGATKTIITGNKNFVDGTPTYKTATIASVGEGFMARDIGIENTAGAEKRQAVAIRVAGDFSVLYHCKFDGFQDTLYAVRGRQFYRECTISGTIDFIFGDAQAVFQNCDILIRKPLDNQQCAVTAQGRTEPNGPGAIVLQNCSISGQPDYVLVKDANPAFLGRPWKPFSRTIVMQSYIDGCISPAGWAPWTGTFGLDTLFYAEYGNRGAGADQAARVTWQGIKKLSPEQVMEFTPDVFFQGSKWVVPTGAPYTAGFMSV